VLQPNPFAKQMADLAPTARLRFVEREAPRRGKATPVKVKILQQWFGENIPFYMRSSAVGEWRDVPLESELTS
jgi:hypothetical protein